jgi:hypothetical protein
MPSDDAIKAALPNVSQIWTTVGETLKGTPFELDEQKISTLTQGTTPFLLQHAETLTPKAQAIGALALVFGPPLLAMGAAYAQAWWKNRKAPPTVAPVVVSPDSGGPG